MKLHVAIAQRKQNYPGEFGLEAIMSATEYTMSDESDIIKNAIEDVSLAGDIEAVAEIIIEVDEEEIRKILFKKTEPIQGKITN